MQLNTTHLSLQYQDGNLSYIKLGEEEIVRMIYTALRNNKWFTVPMIISKEEVIQHANSFSIHYTAQYLMDDIDYEATVAITGDEHDVISFHFKGEAKSRFLKNRIGICIHHPIKECMDQSAHITQPDSKIVDSSFSNLIEPFVLFRDIQKFSWKTPNQVEALLEFEGDIFESEDQRNWSDSSYKTYSTPVGIPFPVMVDPGDIVEQKVILSVGNKHLKEQEKTVANESIEQRIPFPAVGYTRGNLPLSALHFIMLKQIIFDHYRVEIDFKPGWIEQLNAAYQEADELNTNLELCVFFDNYISEYEQVRQHLNSQVKSLLILQKGGSVIDPFLFDYIIPRLRTEFPWIKIGSGTNNHFVDINRSRIIDPRLDFISYGATPQAHLPFSNILVENLEAFQYPITTIRSFSDKNIHISPITLKARDYPTHMIDNRQHTEFIAEWTAISLKYLAGASHLTLFETIGPKGIINEHGPSPVYDLLKKITDFNPKFIIKTKVDFPLEKDKVILENEKGNRMTIEAVFKTGLK